MINTHLLTMHQSRRKLARTQNELLLAVFLKSIADSFVSLYVPIYLFTHGVGLRGVLLYCIVVFSATFGSMLVGLKACQLFGVKKVFVAGTLSTALFYWLLHALVPSADYLQIALVDGLAIGFYFAGYNLLLTRAVTRSKEMKGYAVLQVFGMIAGAVGPLIGALFIKRLSFGDLFLVVVGILAVSPLPLLFSKGYRAKTEPLQLATLFQATPARRRIDRTVFLQGFLYATGTIWPLYLYMHYPHIVALGVITSITGLLMIVGTYSVGRFIGNHTRAAYRFGAFLYAPTWLTRLLFVTPLGLGLNACAASLLGIIPTMAVAKDIFHTAKNTSNRSAHFARVEFYMDLGRVVAFAIGLVAANLSVMFICSSLAALAYLSCVPLRARAKRRLNAQPAGV